MTDQLHPAVAKATEAGFRLCIVEGDLALHSVYCPNGWADVPALTNCGMSIQRFIRESDPFFEPCDACVAADLAREGVANA